MMHGAENEGLCILNVIYLLSIKKPSPNTCFDLFIISGIQPSGRKTGIVSSSEFIGRVNTI